jgi:arylsulfatase A-like enzyme
MIWALDIVSTMLGTAGGTSVGMEGINLLAHLSENPRAFPERTMMWRYTVGSAIRFGSWKLARLPDRLPMLFDLAYDPAEFTDLSATHQKRTQLRLEQLGRWEAR